MTHMYKIASKRRGILDFFSVTTNLIILNVLFFIIAMIWTIFVRANFFDYIALKPSNILQGKYLWTFLTSMFMHAGVLHLFVNMLSLMFVGNFTEKIIGRKRFLWFYLIAGLFAGLLFVGIEYLFPSGLDVGAVGASGALFGVVGLLMLLTPNLPVYIMFIPIPIKMKYAAPGMLLVLWLISLAPLAFGGEQILIGNTAHLGGLLVGIIYGVYLRNKYKRKVAFISKQFS